MRVNSLGRWAGRLTAVAVLGMGATLGASAAVVVDEAGPLSVGAADEATADSSDGGASTESYEWN